MVELENFPQVRHAQLAEHVNEIMLVMSIHSALNAGQVNIPMSIWVYLPIVVCKCKKMQYL